MPISIISKHIIASTIVLVLCVVMFIESLNYSTNVALLPQILLVIIALLSIGMSIEAFVKNSKSKKEDNKEIDSQEKAGETVDDEKINKKRLVIIVMITIIYIVTIDTVGYFIVTPLFLLATLLYLKSTKVLTAILISLGMTAFIYGLFSEFLNIPIPMGLLA